MTATRRIPDGVLPVLTALLIMAPACRTADEHRVSADEEVYGILADLRLRYVEDPEAFTIEPAAAALRERLRAGEITGPQDLVKCLDLAAQTSASYQDRREQLYLAALDLTFERYLFDPQGIAGLGSSVTRLGPGSTTGQVDGSAQLSRVLGSGAKIVGSMGVRLFQNLSTGDGFDAVTDLGLTLTQPLLRGSGKRIVQELLTQAERDVVYEARGYERFRRTYSVDIATRVYRILQQADVVANEQLNIENLRVLRERNQELAAAGRLSDIQVDQARQDELRSENRLIVEAQRYEGQLDDLKRFLSLPVEVPFEPDPIDLERLAEVDPEPLDHDEQTLAELALRERLDYLTALDRVDDAERGVMVAEDALRAGMGLVLDVDASSKEGRPLEFSQQDLTWSLGLDLDLPIDRLAERNDYRAALITLQGVERDLIEFEDRIRADLRAALREAEATIQTYEIQRGAVTLAERRVESARLRLDAGRADTRDILEAQEDLLEARNAATRARIDHHLARLELYRDAGVLRVDASGIAVEETLIEDRTPQP